MDALLIFFGSLIAGGFGAMTGLGGGVIIVPLLLDVVGMPLYQAITISLVAMIANSSAASSVELRHGQMINMRLLVFLSIPAVIGAVIGALTGIYSHPVWVVLLFGLVVLVSALLSFFSVKEKILTAPEDPLAKKLKLNGVYDTPEGPSPYYLHHIGWGAVWMLFAGWLSGILGIGSGVLSVVVFNRMMKLPFRVAAATSNAMISIIVAASIGIYFFKGDFPPLNASISVIGVLIGAFLGAHLATRLPTRSLKHIFAVIVLCIAIRMLWQGIAML